MPARYPVHVIDEHIWNKTDPHPDKRNEDRGSKIEDRLGSAGSILDLRSSILDPLRFLAALIATRTTPQKHRDSGRKSPEPQHPPITIRPGNPERRRQNKTLVVESERLRPGHKNRYHVWNADQRMGEQIRRLSQPRFREEQRQCEQCDKNNGRFFRQERGKKEEK